MKRPSPTLILFVLIAVLLIAGVGYWKSNTERMAYWLGNEAQPSEAAENAITGIGQTDGAIVISGTAAPSSKVTIMRKDEVLAQTDVTEGRAWKFAGKPDEAWPILLTITWQDPKDAEKRQSQLLLCMKNGAGISCLLSEDGYHFAHVPDAVSGTMPPKAVAVDFVHYHAEALIDIMGRAQPGGWIQIYADNQLAGVARVEADGYWHMLPTLRTWRETKEIRLDRLDEDARVVERRYVTLALLPPAALDKPEPARVVDAAARDGTQAYLTYSNGNQPAVLAVLTAQDGRIEDPEAMLPGQAIPELQDLRLTNVRRPAVRMAAPAGSSQ